MVWEDFSLLDLLLLKGTIAHHLWQPSGKSLVLEHFVAYSLPADRDCKTILGTQTEEKASSLK
jgi:hypothetical protein